MDKSIILVNYIQILKNLYMYATILSDYPMDDLRKLQISSELECSLLEIAVATDFLEYVFILNLCSTSTC